MNKRFIILLHILFFSIPILLGNMISAEGQGKTIEEAKLNARVELASQFSMTISSEQWLIIKDSNSSSETKETFLENTKTEVNIELLGVKFDNQKVNNSQFSVTAYLDDSSTSIYVEKLKILKKSIEEIETSISSDVQIDFLKHKFAFLISYYEQFEIYSTIALIMDPNLDLPTLTKTKAGAELALLNLLKKENIELEEKLRDSITRDLTSSQLQSTENELLIEMEIAAQKLKSNQQILQEYEKAEKIRADNLQRLTNEKIKEAVFLMNNKAKDELQNISRIVDSIDPAELISRIEQKKQSYSKIRSELINHINQQSVTINTRFDNLINEVELRSYRTAELSNGKPTNEAKKVRENEIYNLEKMRDLEIEQMVKELNSSQVAIMDDLLKSIINDYKLLENSTYYVQSGIDNISVNIGSYDGYRKSWPVAFSVDILQKEIFQDIYLPYENITKSKLPSFSITEKNKNAYSTYLDNVDLFEMFFSTADNPLSLKIAYNILKGDGPSEYYINLIEGHIFRSDIHEEIYSFDFSNTPIDSIGFTYEDPTDLTNELSKIRSIGVEKIREKEQQLLFNAKKNNNRNWYYKDGLFITLGTGNSIHNKLAVEETNAVAFRFSYYKTPIHFLYVGLSGNITQLYKVDEVLDDELILSEKNILAITGLVYPINSKKAEKFIVKPFAHFGIGTDFSSLCTVLGGGVSFSFKHNDVESMDYEIVYNYQLSGTNAGLWNLTFGANILGYFGIGIGIISAFT